MDLVSARHLALDEAQVRNHGAIAGLARWTRRDGNLDQLALANGHVDFLAGFGDLFAQALVLAFELAGVHAQYLAQEGPVAGISLALELLQRVFDLIGEIEQELGLPFNVGERLLEARRWRSTLFRARADRRLQATWTALRRHADRSF